MYKIVFLVCLLLLLSSCEPIVLEDPAMQNDTEAFFQDNFNNYNQTNCLNGGDSIGQWEIVFSGYGCVDIEDEKIVLEPQTSISHDETHAALVVGPEFSSGAKSFNYHVSLFTEKQLREENPNQWEVGWIVWHYIDNDHFYYLILKPNGYELGKRDPSYEGGQRFLITGSEELFETNTWYDVQIIQEHNEISVFVDNEEILTFFDYEDPYLEGKIGLYTEDAKVYFDNVSVE